MICTTLNKIREHGPCEDGWHKLLKHLGKTEADDKPLPLLTVLDSNGLDDCLWCLRSVPEHDREWRLFAVWCARKVQHLMTDPRNIAALDVAERFANGLATTKELAAARDAARDAARATWASAGDAARATWASARAAAGDAAGDAARSTLAAVRDAARVTWATWAAVGDAAWDAAWAAVGDAAWAAARAEQRKELIRIISE
jgi:hypothetical protein